MMVALLIAMVVAALGYVAYKRRAALATGAGPAKVPDTYEQYGEIDFLVKPGTDTQHAIDSGATAYDRRDPATAQRTLDAIARADAMTALATKQGTTVNQIYINRTAQDVAKGYEQTAAVVVFSKAHGGFTPRTNGDLYEAELTQKPLMDAKPQPPGTYWDYAINDWAPLTF